MVQNAKKEMLTSVICGKGKFCTKTLKKNSISVNITYLLKYV